MSAQLTTELSGRLEWPFLKLSRLHAAIVLASLLAAAFHAFAQPVGTKVFESKSDGYKITLPGDWMEMSASELRRFAAGFALKNPDSRRPNFMHGYQPPTVSGRMTLPCIIVDVNDDGPISEESIRDMAARISLTNSTQASPGDDQSMKPLRSGVLSASYFEFGSMLAMRYRWAGQNQSQIVDADTFLTSRGALTFYCFSGESDADSRQNVINPAIVSVQLDARTANSRANRKQISFGFSDVAFLLGCVVFTIIALAVVRWLLLRQTARARAVNV